MGTTPACSACALDEPENGKRHKCETATADMLSGSLLASAFRCVVSYRSSACTEPRIAFDSNSVGQCRAKTRSIVSDPKPPDPRGLTDRYSGAKGSKRNGSGDGGDFGRFSS